MKNLIFIDDRFLSKLSKHFGKNKNFWNVTQIIRVLSPEVNKFKCSNYINIVNENIYKFQIIKNIDMLPGDSSELPDESFFSGGVL